MKSATNMGTGCSGWGTFGSKVWLWMRSYYEFTQAQLVYQKLFMICCVKDLCLHIFSSECCISDSICQFNNNYALKYLHVLASKNPLYASLQQQWTHILMLSVRWKWQLSITNHFSHFHSSAVSILYVLYLPLLLIPCNDLYHYLLPYSDIYKVSNILTCTRHTLCGEII